MTRIRYIADRLCRAPDPGPDRDLAGVRGIVLHHSAARNGPEAMARWHVLHRGWPTIGYHFAIDGNPGPSLVYQTAELEAATNHAGLHNRSRIGVVIVGNFDEGRPHPNQTHAAAWLCGLLCDVLELGDPCDRTGPWLLPGPVVAGHRELFGATSKPGKTCPGERFDMTIFRNLASEAYRDRLAAGVGRAGAIASGLVMPEERIAP